MKSRLMIFGLFVLAPVAVVAVWMILPTGPTDPLDADKFHRIEVGMTESEVRELFGHCDYGFESGHDANGRASQRQWNWYRNDGEKIVVLLEPDGDRGWIVQAKRCEFPTIWDHLDNWWNRYCAPPSKAKCSDKAP